MNDGRFVVLQEGTDAPLFCCHLLNGRVDPYEPFIPHVPETLPVYGLTLQPLDGSRRPMRTIPEMSVIHADTIDEVYPTGPVRLLGYSWGGQVAHQTAVELAERGREVTFLGLIDTWHPDDRRRSDRIRQVAADLKVRHEPGRASIPSRLKTRFSKLPGRLWYYVKLCVVAPLNLPHSEEMQRRRFVRIGLAMRDHHMLGSFDGPVTFFQVDTLEFASPTDTAGSWRRTVNATVISISGTHRGPRSAMLEPKVAETAKAVMASMRGGEDGS
jgi:thioesterase domain-containing protein